MATASASSMRTRNHPSMCLRRKTYPRKLVSCAAGGGYVVREVLSSSARQKLDTGDDREFYSMPRFVKHVDDGFLKGVTELYRQRIKPGSDVLDLMSSWVSHLPADVKLGRVVGHGMNAAELARNPQLDEFFVRNLNLEPDGWASADESFDAVVCCVSVQYMQKPELVFKEINRVLRPGGVCIMTFSNRMFYTKAVAAWRESSDYGHCQLVKQYFQCVEGFTPAEVLNKAPTPVQGSQSQESIGKSPLDDLIKLIPGAEMVRNMMGGGSSDPFYAVLAYKNFKPEDAK